MPVNYRKEFLKSLHTGVVLSELFSRASNGCQYSRSWNFQLKISLCSVFQHTEFKFHGCSWIWDFRVCISIVYQIQAWTVDRQIYVKLQRLPDSWWIKLATILFSHVLSNPNLSLYTSELIQNALKFERSFFMTFTKIFLDFFPIGGWFYQTTIW